MKMPDVTGGFADLWSYIKIDRPHRIPAMGVSIVLPIVIIYLFFHSFQEPPDTKTRIVYIENWRADRSDQEVRREWLERAKATNARRAKLRKSYQRLADELGIDYNSSEADRITRETETMGVDAVAKLQLEAAEKRSAAAE